TVPPGGPTWRQLCAGVAAVAARASAPIPNHFKFMTMHSPRAQRRPQGASVGSRLAECACSVVQILVRLFIVLVRPTPQASLGPRRYSNFFSTPVFDSLARRNGSPATRGRQPLALIGQHPIGGRPKTGHQNEDQIQRKVEAQRNASFHSVCGRSPRI